MALRALAREGCATITTEFYSLGIVKATTEAVHNILWFFCMKIGIPNRLKNLSNGLDSVINWLDFSVL